MEADTLDQIMEGFAKFGDELAMVPEQIETALATAFAFAKFGDELAMVSEQIAAALATAFAADKAWLALIDATLALQPALQQMHLLGLVDADPVAYAIAVGPACGVTITEDTAWRWRGLSPDHPDIVELRRLLQEKR